MKSRLWLNLTLLALIGILVLLVIYEPGTQKQTQVIPLTSLHSDDIKRILIRRENPGKVAEEILLEKTAGHWFMRQPYDLPANDFRVRSLLRLAETESFGRHALGELKPQTYGLNTPRATVTFNDNTLITFGNTEPLSHRRYVQLGDQLNLIEDTFYYLAAGNLSIYLDHALLPADAKISRLALPDLSLELKDGHWQRAPEHKDISADANVELVNAWRHAQAVEVRTSKHKPASRPEAGIIRIHLQDQASAIEFTIEKTENETILTRRDNGLQYVVTPDLARQLLSLPAAEDTPADIPAIDAD